MGRAGDGDRLLKEHMNSRIGTDITYLIVELVLSNMIADYLKSKSNYNDR